MIKVAVGVVVLAIVTGGEARAFEPGHVVEGHAVAIDGDTIRIGETRVRLNGVAAPELSEDFGKASAVALSEILTAGVVRCSLSGAMSYNREVGTCWIGTADIGALIIAQGLARDCPRYSGGRYAAVEPPESKDLPLPRYCKTGK